MGTSTCFTKERIFDQNPKVLNPTTSLISSKWGGGGGRDILCGPKHYIILNIVVLSQVLVQTTLIPLKIPPTPPPPPMYTIVQVINTKIQNIEIVEEYTLLCQGQNYIFGDHI